MGITPRFSSKSDGPDGTGERRRPATRVMKPGLGGSSRRLADWPAYSYRIRPMDRPAGSAGIEHCSLRSPRSEAGTDRSGLSSPCGSAHAVDAFAVTRGPIRCHLHHLRSVTKVSVDTTREVQRLGDRSSCAWPSGLTVGRSRPDADRSRRQRASASNQRLLIECLELAQLPGHRDIAGCVEGSLVGPRAI